MDMTTTRVIGPFTVPAIGLGCMPLSGMPDRANNGSSMSAIKHSELFMLHSMQVFVSLIQQISMRQPGTQLATMKF
jgi:hypothetical protein